MKIKDIMEPASWVQLVVVVVGSLIGGVSVVVNDAIVKEKINNKKNKKIEE